MDDVDRELKTVFELPQAQQRALHAILRLRRDVFRTSDVSRKIEDFAKGKAAGAVLGALYRNGFLKKISGDRDKTWRLADEASRMRDELRGALSEVKEYWY